MIPISLLSVNDLNVVSITETSVSILNLKEILIKIVYTYEIKFIVVVTT